MQPTEHLKLETAGMAWQPMDSPGLERKRLGAEAQMPLHETCVMRLAPGARLPPLPESWGLEAVVLDGRWELPEGALETHGYARRPPGHVGSDSTADGCVLFVRATRFDAADRELVHSQTDEQPWLPGHGGLRVKPLHTFGGEGTALVHWPAGERFIPHQHWGGEEILVLSGTFMDEHGSYPTGTWLRSPHLSAHHPFVEQETVIFVKTGHLGPVPGPVTGPAGQ